MHKPGRSFLCCKYYVSYIRSSNVHVLNLAMPFISHREGAAEKEKENKRTLYNTTRLRSALSVRYVVYAVAVMFSNGEGRKGKEERERRKEEEKKGATGHDGSLFLHLPFLLFRFHSHSQSCSYLSSTVRSSLHRTPLFTAGDHPHIHRETISKQPKTERTEATSCLRISRQAYVQQYNLYSASVLHPVPDLLPFTFQLHLQLHYHHHHHRHAHTHTARVILPSHPPSCILAISPSHGKAVVRHTHHLLDFASVFALARSLNSSDLF